MKVVVQKEVTKIKLVVEKPSQVPVKLIIDRGAGLDGKDGIGIPVGGSVGQVLQKTSGTDYDVSWVNLPGSTLNVTSKTSNYTLLSTDRVILGNATTGSFVITLPNPNTVTGILFTVKKTDASSNTVSVTPSSGQIDGGSTAVLKRQGASIDFISDGSNYFIK